MAELSEKESRDLRVLVDEIPPDGWWRRSNAETFTDLAQVLMDRGFTASAAVELLESAYAAVAGEFGS